MSWHCAKVETLFQDFRCLNSIVTTHSKQHVELYLDLKLKQTESADSICYLSICL
jgi:hypothetical protein